MLYQTVEYALAEDRPRRPYYHGYEVREGRFLLIFHCPSDSEPLKVHELTWDPETDEIFHNCRGFGRHFKSGKLRATERPLHRMCWHVRFVAKWVRRTRNKKNIESAMEAIRMLREQGFLKEMEAA